MKSYLCKTVLFIPILLLLTPLLTFAHGQHETDTTIAPRCLNIPKRAANALSGSAFAKQVWSLGIEEREQAVVKEILSGNVPSFSRTLKAITTHQIIGDSSYAVTFFALCDYMGIGSDEDYFYIPMTPATAQYLADQLDCILPTRKLVDTIYDQADIKLRPQPIAPSDTMTTLPVFWQHTNSIKQQFAQLGIQRTADMIVGGNKKDIIISNKIYDPKNTSKRVVIYGWHKDVNEPIQPVYSGHIASYADYSHGVRLISDTLIVNGKRLDVRDVLSDENLWRLLNDEGTMRKPKYELGDFVPPIGVRRQVQ